MRPNPNTNYELLRDLRLSRPVTSSPVEQEGSVRVFCTEGCTNTSFGRTYDLKRHVEEQHRCPHENCESLKFATNRETAAHRAQHGVGFRCGTCELKGGILNSFIRAEKLKKHFKKTHKASPDVDLANFQCILKPCLVGKACGGLFFVSSADLKEHHNRVHSSALPLQSEPEKTRVGELYDF
jgi:hypothetical protein